jgi:hypothetical protein
VRTGSRRQSSARERADTGVTAEQILANPYLLIGTVEYIVETLERRREQFGISYLPRNAQREHNNEVIEGAEISRR